MNAFAMKLGNYRCACDLGIREAAREIGISSATLCRVETGRIPSVQALWRICCWSGIRAEWALQQLHDAADVTRKVVIPR